MPDAKASIMLPLAALVSPHRAWRGLRFASSPCCARPRVVRLWLPPVGRAHATYSNNPPVLGSPASLIGSELPRYWAPALAFSHRRKRGPAASPPDAAADPTLGIIATRARASQPSPCSSSKHKAALCEKPLIGVCVLALLGSTISSSLSRPPLIPLRGPAVGFSIRTGPVL